MGFGSFWHWVIVLVVVVLIFGTARLRHAGRDLGEAVKGFRKGMRDGDERGDTPPDQTRDSIDDPSATNPGDDRDRGPR